jgi:hypothetical protein
LVSFATDASSLLVLADVSAAVCDGLLSFTLLDEVLPLKGSKFSVCNTEFALLVSLSAELLLADV